MSAAAITPWGEIEILVGALRGHAVAALRVYESARKLLKKYVRVENGSSTYLGSGYGEQFMNQLGVMLIATLTQAGIVSRLLDPKSQTEDDARRRNRHLRQALEFSGDFGVDRYARNNMEHVEHRLNWLISHSRSLPASSYSQGFVITRQELSKAETPNSGPALFCWALVPDEMTLITVNRNGTRHETNLTALVDQLRDLITRCERWREVGRRSKTRKPYRD